MSDEFCPCCGRHCPLDSPHCDRGREYAKTGVVSNDREKGHDGKGHHAHDHRRHHEGGRHHHS